MSRPRFESSTPRIQVYSVASSAYSVKLWKSLGQSSRFSGEEFKPECSEYEEGMLATAPRYSACDGDVLTWPYNLTCVDLRSQQLSYLTISPHELSKLTASQPTDDNSKRRQFATCDHAVPRFKREDSRWGTVYREKTNNGKADPTRGLCVFENWF